MVWSNPSGDLKAGTVPAGLPPGTSTTLSPKKQVLRIYARSCNLNDFKLYEQWGAYSEQRCTLGARGCILRAERCILDTGILAIEGALRSGHAGSSLPCSRLSYIIEQQDPDDEDDDDNDDDAGLAMSVIMTLAMSIMMMLAMSIMMTLAMTIIMTLKMLIMMTPAMSIIMTLGMSIMMMPAMLIMMTLALSIMITIAMSIMMSSLSLKLSSSNMIPAHCWSAMSIVQHFSAAVFRKALIGKLLMG